MLVKTGYLNLHHNPTIVALRQKYWGSKMPTRETVSRIDISKFWSKKIRPAPLLCFLAHMQEIPVRNQSVRKTSHTIQGPTLMNPC